MPDLQQFEAIEKVFGTPDAWRVRPTTYGEVDPVALMQAYREKLMSTARRNTWERYPCMHCGVPTHNLIDCVTVVTI